MSELDKKWLNCAYWGKCELEAKYIKQKKKNKRLKEEILLVAMNIRDKNNYSHQEVLAVDSAMTHIIRLAKL